MKRATQQDISLRVLQAEQAGLVRVYFPNGTTYDGFYEQCERCHHCIDDRDDPKPPRLTPPFNTCRWGVLDRIIHSMGYPEMYGYGTSFHSPEDMRLIDEMWPECNRFYPRSDDNDPSINHPPPPDCKGQLTFSDVLEVMEREIRPQEARA